ncbi:MAG TPA: porin [Polyangia bacterium]|nr:porin [Polyangia bacterium]
MRNLLASVVTVAIGLSPLVAFGQAATPADELAAAPAAAPAQSAPAPVTPADVTPAVAAAPPAPAAPATPAAPPPIAFTWEALVDAYYMYNFTGKPSLQGPGAPRQFDVAANSFSLNYAKLGVGADTEYVAFRMDLGAGHMAALINGAGGLASASVPSGAPPTVPATLSASQYGNDFVVQQAFATVKPTAWLSVDAGRFVTTASAEVIEANKNWLYSRSMLFYGVPLLHTGVRVNTTVNPSLKLQASLVNGWNNDPDNNIGKTFGANATFAPPDSGLNASLTGYIGKETTAGSGGNTRVLIDGVFTKDIAQASVGLNIDYLKDGTPYWIGAAAMGKYTFTDLFNVAARFELVSSKAGGYTSAFPTPTPPPVTTPPTPPAADPRGGDVFLYEGTLMGGLTVAKHFELRLELRGDFANKEIFQKGAATDVVYNRKNQFTGLLAFLAYF